MIYKTLKKVSDYCQLLDKSKYPATQTIYGVTFTNNGDGTITVNGTAESGSGFRLDTFYIEGNRTYLMTGCPEGGGAGKYFMFDGYSVMGYDLGSGIIKTISGSNRTLCSPILYITTGTTVSNLVFKPQIFDLTEMYGAGNEPTTVKQFRQDFPNEMYDYKPYCFVKSYKNLLKATDNKIITSYKKSLFCKTKNLFDINTTPTFNNTKATYVVEGTKVTFKSNNTANISFFYSIPTTVGKTYTVSVNSIDWDSASLGIFLSSVKSVDNLDYGRIQKTVLTQTFVAVSDTLWIHGYLSYPAGDFTFTFDKLQVELGDTATDYVPYGHL